jgi:hypothetical protein
MIAILAAHITVRHLLSLYISKDTVKVLPKLHRESLTTVEKNELEGTRD